MKKIRQRNDIDIVVRLTNNEGEVLNPLVLSDMKVYLSCGIKNIYISDYERSENCVKFRFLADEQTRLGVYNIVISAMTEDGRTFTTDVCEAFNLVACSCETGGDSGEVSIETIEVDASFEISAWGMVDNTEAIAELERKVDKIVYRWDSFDVSVKEGKVSQEVYDNLLISDVVTNNGAVFNGKIVEGTSIILVYQSSGEGGEGLLGYGVGFITVKEDLSYTIESFEYNLPSEDLVDKKLSAKQDILVSGNTIKTINNQSILGEGNITIEGGGGSVIPKITDTLNVTSVDAIKQAQAKLTNTYDVAFFLITDSAGMLPSTSQEAVNVSIDCIRQLSLSSPNSAVQAIIGGTSIDGVKPRGMNVGDIIALARVPVSIDALARYIGLSSAVVSALKLLGLSSIEVYQYKIWVTTSTKWREFRNPDGTIVKEGVEGLMSIYDKNLVDKIPSIDNMVSANDMSTRYGYGVNFDDCLTTGVCAYSPATIGGVTENFTLVVQRSSTVDSGGFYTIIQSAYGRTGEVYNRIFQRMIFHNPNNGTIERHDWVELTESEVTYTYIELNIAPDQLYPYLRENKIDGHAIINSEDSSGNTFFFDGYVYPIHIRTEYRGMGMIYTNEERSDSEFAMLIIKPYGVEIIRSNKIKQLEDRIATLEAIITT